MPQVASVRVELYGSLGATDKGHGTDRSVILGLKGEVSDTIGPDATQPMLPNTRRKKCRADTALKDPRGDRYRDLKTRCWHVSERQQDWRELQQGCAALAAASLVGLKSAEERAPFTAALDHRFDKPRTSLLHG
ncbi:serine dehydratase beta chain [Ralstonia mojiangensis]|uniref:serine dehydratase beta chain n=1 Tax=Ralstonia mojiangensis TaxID=2953895 RepID=UPI003709AA5E